MGRTAAAGFLCLSVLMSAPGTLGAQEAKPAIPVESKFRLKIYGFIKLDGVYDDAQIHAGNVALYVKPQTSGKDNQFNFTLNQTRLGLFAQVPDLAGMEAGGRVEMDFYGGGAENTPTPRLYKGFIELKWPTFQILAGQDWDTHSSLYPTMVNFGYLGDSGNIQFRRPQLRLTKLFPFLETSRVTLAAAIARTISGDQDGFGKNDGDDSGIPTLEGRLAYENQRAGSVPFMVAASGHYGKQEIDWDESGTDTEYKSWSANGELMVPLWGDRLSLKGEYFYGSNLDAYYGGIGQGINKATRQAIRATGGWGEFTVKPFVRTLLHLGAGVDHPKGGNLVTGDRSQNFSTFANVSYDVFSFLTLAFEYSHWRTSYKDGATSTDNRYHTALIMNF